MRTVAQKSKNVNFFMFPHLHSCTEKLTETGKNRKIGFTFAIQSLPSTTLGFRMGDSGGFPSEGARCTVSHLALCNRAIAAFSSPRHLFFAGVEDMCCFLEGRHCPHKHNCIRIQSRSGMNDRRSQIHPCLKPSANTKSSNNWAAVASPLSSARVTPNPTFQVPEKCAVGKGSPHEAGLTPSTASQEPERCILRVAAGQPPIEIVGCYTKSARSRLGGGSTVFRTLASDH